MFDVSFVELMIIGAVALLVLGPERLPAAARTLGGFMRRARASWTSLRTEFERELSTEDLKRSMAKTVRDLDVRADIQEALTPPSITPPPVTPPVPAEPVARSPRPPHD
jgi:sec-independent protein translocase protein TatB